MNEIGLLAVLKGRVFHATSLENYYKIIHYGGLYPNPLGDVKSPFGVYRNGFFKRRGCVSFFDYRNHEGLGWKNNHHKCNPCQLLHKNEMAFLFLSPSKHEILIPWKKWKEEQAWSEQVVPHIEVGHPGMVLLSDIEEVVIFGKNP